MLKGRICFYEIGFIFHKGQDVLLHTLIVGFDSLTEIIGAIFVCGVSDDGNGLIGFYIGRDFGGTSAVVLWLCHRKKTFFRQRSFGVQVKLQADYQHFCSETTKKQIFLGVHNKNDYTCQHLNGLNNQIYRKYQIVQIMGLYQYLQNRIKELGDADFLAAFDDQVIMK